MTSYTATTTTRIIADRTKDFADIPSDLVRNPNDEPISILSILYAHGLDVALTVLKWTEADERLARRFHAYAIGSILHISDDQRIIDRMNILLDDSASPENRESVRLTVRKLTDDLRGEEVHFPIKIATWVADNRCFRTAHLWSITARLDHKCGRRSTENRNAYDNAYFQLMAQDGAYFRKILEK